MYLRSYWTNFSLTEISSSLLYWDFVDSNERYKYTHLIWLSSGGGHSPCYTGYAWFLLVTASTYRILEWRQRPTPLIAVFSVYVSPYFLPTNHSICTIQTCSNGDIVQCTTCSLNLVLYPLLSHQKNSTFTANGTDPCEKKMNKYCMIHQ